MIFAVLINIKSQDEASKKYCFGECGEIICAGIDLGEMGSSFVCRKDVCRYEENRSPQVGDLDEEPVFIRKLNKD